MHLRDYEKADLAAAYRVVREWEQHWFGAIEQSEDEFHETLELCDRIVVLVDDDRIVGVAGRWSTGSQLSVDPTVDLGRAYPPLLDWLDDVAAHEIEAYGQDTVLTGLLGERGWRHAYSAYDLMRSADDTWTVDAPQWPAGYGIQPFLADDAPILHSLIYRDAGWAEVPGHHDREFEEWQRIFLDGRPEAELPILVWHDDRLVAASVLRQWDDGTGWVSQLAVAREHRRHGLARSLLVESIRRLRVEGAKQVGLSVSVDNRKALDLYLSVGLEVTREWQTYLPG